MSHVTAMAEEWIHLYVVSILALGILDFRSSGSPGNTGGTLVVPY